MESNQIPITCTLTSEELSDRQSMLSHLASCTTEIQEQDNGFSYRFASDAILPELIEMIQSERRCCPFLRFAIDCEPGNGPIWLHLSGPSGTKELIAELFTLASQ